MTSVALDPNSDFAEVVFAGTDSVAFDPSFDSVTFVVDPSFVEAVFAGAFHQKDFQAYS